MLIERHLRDTFPPLRPCQLLSVRTMANDALKKAELAEDAAFQISRVAGTASIVPEALRGRGGEGLEVGELETEAGHGGAGNLGRRGGGASEERFQRIRRPTSAHEAKQLPSKCEVRPGKTRRHFTGRFPLDDSSPLSCGRGEGGLLVNMPETRKAFISHASEDKERFVEAFVRRLREKGVDAWYDEWEIQPGDSIVDKIFEHGIKKADVFIVFLSRNSVDKPWVREELESGVVQRINRTCRIIPVVLDDCEVPTALGHLRWEKIRNIEDYDSEFKRIVNVIFGGSDRPPLGPPPAHYAHSCTAFVPGLTKTDNLVFEILGNFCLPTGRRGVELSKVSDHLAGLGISDVEVSESLEMLEKHYLLDSNNCVQKFNPSTGENDYIHVFLTKYAMVLFARATLSDYERMFADVVSGIVNRGYREGPDFEALTAIPPEILELIVMDLEEKDLIHLLIGSNGLFHQLEPKGPGLKRLLG